MLYEAIYTVRVPYVSQTKHRFLMILLPRVSDSNILWYQKSNQGHQRSIGCHTKIPRINGILNCQEMAYGVVFSTPTTGQSPRTDTKIGTTTRSDSLDIFTASATEVA